MTVQIKYKRVGLLGRVKPEGAPRPRFYFFGYEDFEHERRVFYPLGIHWAVQFWRSLKLRLVDVITRSSHNSYRERIEWESYHRGYDNGFAQGYEHGKNSRAV